MQELLDLSYQPQRIVSLVPSMTETLFELGLSEQIVGVSDYCNRPSEQTRGLPKVGGPKNPHLKSILDLKPDFVIASREENPPEIVHDLEIAKIPVWVTFPQTVQDVIAELWNLVGLYKDENMAKRVRGLTIVLDWTRALGASSPGFRYFCPIWQETTATGETWWMTFNQHTYSHDLLVLFGGINVFAERARRYPLEADLGLIPTEPPRNRDTRYPRITVEEVRRANPDVILLPDEPFVFGEAQRDQMVQLLPEVSAIRNNRLVLLDGSLITWPGLRLAFALNELPAILSE